MQIDELGRRATALLKDEGFLAIIAAMKDLALRDWANTKPEEEAKREGLYRDIQAVGRLENTVRVFAENKTMTDRKAEQALKRAGAKAAMAPPPADDD